jgi:hypothetical protein
MRVTAISGEQGVVAISYFPAGHVQGTDQGGLEAGPGQTLHELDVEEDLLRARDVDALHRRVTELIASSGR